MFKSEYLNRVYEGVESAAPAKRNFCRLYARF